jgi:hypothetical protein
MDKLLFTLTALVDFGGMVVSLWLALYLFGRGYRSRITLRAVVVLLALSAFFLGAYTNLYLQIPGTAAARSTLLIVGLSTWHDLTHNLLPEGTQKKLKWLVGVIYALGLLSVVLLLNNHNTYIGEAGNVLWVARMGISLPYIIFGFTQGLASLFILYNFSVGARVGSGLQNRYFLIASILVVSTVAYGILALAITPPMPRLVQDFLIFSSIVLLGFSVARYQTLVERRATLHDFPISALAVFGLTGLYILVAWLYGSPPIQIILVAALAVMSHSIFNLVHEFLDRLRSKDENDIRRQLRKLENNAWLGVPLRERLMEGLRLMCRNLESGGGFIAVRQKDLYVVSATFHSIPVGFQLLIDDYSCDDICKAPPEIEGQVAWIAPGFGGGEQVAVIGINAPKARTQYSDTELDILAEAADRIGTIVYLHNLRPLGKDTLNHMSSEIQSHEADIQAKSQALIATLVNNPDPKFVKIVEEGLRNLSDYITLGQSELTNYLDISADTHIERGKAVRQLLVDAIETLRPDQERPAQPLPREWYSFAVLHDAYIEDAPNREIMARLYISEGTFNRSRQKALRGIARVLMEKKGMTE